MGASGIRVGSDLSDRCNVYPVKALRASSAALRPAVTGQSLPLRVVHAESGAFGQLGRMNLLLGWSQLDKQRGCTRAARLGQCRQYADRVIRAPSCTR